MTSQAKNDEYVLGKSNVELERLRINHQMYKRALNDKLISAPVTEHLAQVATPRILDSGTADGTWLVDVLNDYPHAILVGTDINPAFFPPSSPNSVTFQQQDVTKEWPQSFSGSFDLVHQRLVLLIHGTQLESIIAGLGALVKPGGWIQLIEMDIRDASGCGPAGTQFLTLLQEFCGAMGGQADYMDCIPDILKRHGFEEVTNSSFETGVGAKNPDESVRKTQSEAHVDPPKMIGSMLKGKSSITDEDLDTLPQRLRDEMLQKGGVFVQKMIVARRMP